MRVAASQLVSWLSLTKEDKIGAQCSCRLALSMTEKLLGPDSPDTAASMFNLATANMLADDCGKGTEGLLVRALQIYELDSVKADNFALHSEARKNSWHLLAQAFIRRYIEIEDRIHLKCITH